VLGTVLLIVVGSAVGGIVLNVFLRRHELRWTWVSLDFRCSGTVYRSGAEACSPPSAQVSVAPRSVSDDGSTSAPVARSRWPSLSSARTS
jgi:hypothetical protein